MGTQGSNSAVIVLLSLIAAMIGLPMLACGGCFILGTSGIRSASEQAAERREAESEEAYFDTAAALERLNRSPLAARVLNFERDEVDRLTRITHRGQPSLYRQKGIDLHIVARDSSKPSLFCRFTYSGDDWLAFDSVTVALGDQRVHRDFGFFNTTRDHTGGRVFETYSDLVDDELEGILRKAGEGEMTVRFHGQDYYSDATVDGPMIQRVHHMLDAYDLLTKAE